MSEEGSKTEKIWITIADYCLENVIGETQANLAAEAYFDAFKNHMKSLDWGRGHKDSPFAIMAFKSGCVPPGSQSQVEWRFRIFQTSSIGTEVDLKTGGFCNPAPWIADIQPYSPVPFDFQPRLRGFCVREFMGEVTYFWNDIVSDIETEDLEHHVDDFFNYSGIPRPCDFPDRKEDPDRLVLWMFNMHTGLGRREIASLVFGAKYMNLHPNSKADEIGTALLTYYTNPANEVYIDVKPFTKESVGFYPPL